MGGKISPANGRTVDSFHLRKIKFTTRLLLLSTLVTFCVETAIMVLLETYFEVSLPLDLIADGLVLIAILLPLNYLLIVRPMSHEIDLHRQTNQDLVESYKILEHLFSINDVMLAYMDAKFNFMRVNKAYADADQHDPAYYIGKNHFALFPHAENQSIFESVVRTGKAFTITDKPFAYPNNPERGVTYWDWSLFPVKDADGQVTHLLFVLTDVTYRKKAQIAVAESEQRFRAVFNQTFQHMALLDPRGNTLLLNQTALAFSGLAADEVTGKPFWQVPWWGTPAGALADPAEVLRSAIQQAASCEVVRYEQQVKAAAGEPEFMDISFKPLLDDQGNTRMIIYEGRSISERLKAEQALRQSEHEIQRLYHAEMRARQRADTLRGAVQALSGSLNSSSVLDILLDNVHQVLPFTSAHILLLQDEDHLAVRFARGEEGWDAPARLLDRSFETSEYPFFHEVLANRQVFSIADARQAPDSLFSPAAQPVLSWLAIPLLAGDQVIGLCLLEHDTAGFFTEDLVQWAVTLTRQASVAIHNAWLFEQVRDNREHLQALSRRLVETQESERHYISRELHDDAGQALASLMFGLRQLELDSSDQAAVIHHCGELKQITDGVIESLHRLAANLRPATLDRLGLVPALRQHAETMSLQHGLAIQFEAMGNIGRLPGEMETAIYRIVQESLTNIVRHARATRVDILLERRDDHLVVVVEDNGLGFDPRAPVSDQLGLLGMRERAVMLGGTITIESAPEKGSTVVLEVPCPSES